MTVLRTIRQAALMVAVTLTLCLLLALPVGPAAAATDNPAQGASGWFLMHWHFDSQLTESVADKASWKMPWPATLHAIKCTARALGGTGGPVYTWTLQEGASTAATCRPTVAGTEVEGTITDATIADEASMTLDYGGAGTNPTADDMDVILIFKRR